MRLPMLAAAAACALALAGCQTVDRQVEATSAKLQTYCDQLRLTVLVADLATRQSSSLIAKANAVLIGVCASPPKDAASAATLVVATILQVQEGGR